LLYYYRFSAAACVGGEDIEILNNKGEEGMGRGMTI
jgi:hypothetical protein